MTYKLVSLWVMTGTGLAVFVDFLQESPGGEFYSFVLLARGILMKESAF